MEYFKDYIYKYFKYCITKDEYSFGTIMYPSQNTLGNLLYNIEHLKDFEDVGLIYKSLNNDNLSLIFDNRKYFINIILLKIFSNSYTISKEYIISGDDIVNFFQEFIWKSDFRKLEKNFHKGGEKMDLKSTLQIALKNILNIKVKSIIDYFEDYGFEYLIEKIKKNLNVDSFHVTLIHYWDKFKNFLYSLTLKDIELTKFNEEIEFESSLILLEQKLYQALSSTYQFHSIQRILSNLNYNQISSILVEYFSENLTVKSLQKLHQAIEKHDFRTLGMMLDHFFNSLTQRSSH